MCIYWCCCCSCQSEANEGPTTGALELMDQEEDMVVEAGTDVEGIGDGDVDDRDEETNAEDDGEVTT